MHSYLNTRIRQVGNHLKIQTLTRIEYIILYNTTLSRGVENVRLIAKVHTFLPLETPSYVKLMKKKNRRPLEMLCHVLSVLA